MNQQILKEKLLSRKHYPNLLRNKKCAKCPRIFKPRNPRHTYCSTACRFWSAVNVTQGDECWLWGKRINYKGYGSFDLDTAVGAHRIAWKLTFGRIPDNLWVLHKCDNRKCCNPSHLFLGTNQDNVDDMMAKGRYGSKRNLPYGPLHRQSKHSTDIVIAVRNGDYTAKECAEIYGVKQKWVEAVRQGKIRVRG